MKTEDRMQNLEDRSQEIGVKIRSSRRAGFSLVEVTLALAIMAIGLIAIIGLIPQGVQSSRDAADNTLAATIVHDIFDTARSKPFTIVDLSSLGFPVTPYNLSVAGPQSDTVYFDSSGIPTSTAADRTYGVTLTFQNVNPSLSQVTARIFWPALSASPINNNVFFTQIANYQ